MIIREEEGRGGANMLMVGVHFDAANAWSGVERHAITHLLSPAHYTCASPILHACPPPIPGTPLFPIGIPISVYELHLFSKRWDVWRAKC